MMSRPALTREDCAQMSTAALAEAQRYGWVVSVAILDDGGHLLHFVRMDGASPASATIAIEKGRTAAVSRRPTKSWEDRITNGRPAMVKMPGILPVRGGLPIVVEGSCVGGIGISGVQSHEDEQIAQAGIDAVVPK